MNKKTSRCPSGGCRSECLTAVQHKHRQTKHSGVPASNATSGCIVWVSLVRSRCVSAFVIEARRDGPSRFRGFSCLRLSRLHKCPYPPPPTPPASIVMPTGNRPGPHSWLRKHCSQPSQKQSCIKHLRDTLTNTTEHKRPGAGADVHPPLSLLPQV